MDSLMKKVVKSLVLASTVLVVSNVQAEMMGDMKPYAGAEVKYSKVKGNNDWQNMLPKNQPGMGVFLGSKFHPNFGAELGYDWSWRKSKDYTQATGASLFGVAASGVSTSSRVSISGPHIDLNGYLPIDQAFEVVGGVGVAYLRTKLQVTTATVGNLGSALNSVQGKSRAALRLNAGVQYKVSDMVGVRLRALWENTKSLRIKHNSAANPAVVGTYKPFNNSFGGGLSAYVMF
jgi:opacity protein-like surface antigen